MSHPSCQKLWRISNEVDGYFVKCNGIPKVPFPESQTDLRRDWYDVRKNIFSPKANSCTPTCPIT